MACYYLARYLDYQASAVRAEKLIDLLPRPQQANFEFSPLMKASWGQDFSDRFKKIDSDPLEREASQLYERVSKEFGDLPLPHPLPNLTDDLLLPGRPTTFGAAARYYLHELKDLGIGRHAPEIEGTDLDGRPMKLSDYRGRVTAIYFCMPDQLRAAGTGRAAAVTDFTRDVAKSHADDPFAVLGVTTVGVQLNLDREAFRSSLKASGLPARFWWDIGQDGKPGPIQTAWNARTGLYVLDHRSVIRYKNVFRPEVFELAVATLLKEQKDELAKAKKAE